MKSQNSAAAGQRSYHHGNLHAHLIQAALEIIQETGGTAFSLRDAARRAGVSHTAPYRHFRSRAAQLAAVAEEGFLAMAQQMTKAMQDAPTDTCARFSRLGLEYVRFATSHPAHFRVMFGPEAAYEHDCAVRSASEAVYDLVRNFLRSAHESGALPPQESLQARTGWALMHGLAALIVDGRIPVASDEALEALVERSQHLLFLGMTQSAD